MRKILLAGILAGSVACNTTQISAFNLTESAVSSLPEQVSSAVSEELAILASVGSSFVAGVTSVAFCSMCDVLELAPLAALVSAVGLATGCYYYLYGYQGKGVIAYQKAHKLFKQALIDLRQMQFCGFGASDDVETAVLMSVNFDSSYPVLTAVNRLKDSAKKLRGALAESITAQAHLTDSKLYEASVQLKRAIQGQINAVLNEIKQLMSSSLFQQQQAQYLEAMQNRAVLEQMERNREHEVNLALIDAHAKNKDINVNVLHN